MQEARDLVVKSVTLSHGDGRSAILGAERCESFESSRVRRAESLIPGSSSRSGIYAARQGWMDGVAEPFERG